MTIVYAQGATVRTAVVDRSELHRWTADHAGATILSATPTRK